MFWNVEGPRGEQGPAGARGATGAPGRDGVDGREGKDGRDAEAPPAVGPIGTLNVDEIHKPEESSPILSVSGGLSVTGDSTGGGGGSGKVNFQDLHVTKSVDQFSPKLYMFGATGRHIPTVDINVFRQGTQDVELARAEREAKSCDGNRKWAGAGQAGPGSSSWVTNTRSLALDTCSRH